MSRYSCCNRTKGGGKNVIVMYTYKDNLTPLLYSGKKKKKERNTKQGKILYLCRKKFKMRNLERNQRKRKKTPLL